MRILVVEDETLIALMLADWLQELGHEVIGPVGTAGEALEAVGAAAIDAALLDLNLPDGDSYEVADRLRSTGVPFAFASGDGGGCIAESFRECPILMKPFEFENVEALLGSISRR